ncbi:MAG: hypothetical protein EB110_11365, partial [Betaproteobacteria bacterium]|nr:hypothetical protein [Betaproteobacteria bacterium]
KQDIAAVSRNTRWNGMSLMDAKAGTLIAPKALYKAVSAGQWVQQYGGQTALKAEAVDTVTSTRSEIDLNASAVTFAHKGKIVVDIANNAAKFFAVDGSTVDLDVAVVPNGAQVDSITLSEHDARGLMSEALIITPFSGSIISQSQRLEINIDSTAALGVLGNKDLNLNGVDIGIKTDDVLDTVSPSGNAAASAITKAAQINRFSAQTGVTAVVNRNLLGGRAMTQGGAMTGTLGQSHRHPFD